jgi:hypothetical protein
MRTISAILSIILVSIFISGVADAEVPLKAYVEAQQGGTAALYKDYIVGVGRGIFWSDTYTSTHGGDKVFCMPGKLALDEGVILSLLD